ncbi:MAG: SIR2 family protein [Dehalococcoidia bacterium]
MTDITLRDDLIQRIASGNVSFFVGAGISQPSGLPSGPALAENVVTAWTRNPIFDTLQPYCRNSALRLEVLLQIVRETIQGSSSVLLPLSSFVKAPPNIYHYLIAQAIRNGSIVATTNFDILIELAYWHLFGNLPQVLVTEDEINAHGADLRGTMVKLHGSLARLRVTSDGWPIVEDTRQTVVGSLDQVAKGLGELKTVALRGILETNLTLFIGYSCMDDFDILPVLKESGRRPYVWTFFDPDKPKSQESDAREWATLLSTTDASRRFEASNVLEVLTTGDTCIFGASGPLFDSLADHFGTTRLLTADPRLAIAIDRMNEQIRDVPALIPPIWQTELLEARLMFQVGEWGKQMHDLYSSVRETAELDENERARIAIEHAERITPNDIRQAETVLETCGLRNPQISADIRAYGLAILANVERRMQTKNPRPIIDEALALIQQNPVEDSTKHFVMHYESLVSHQEVAQAVRKLPVGATIPVSVAAQLMRCEITLGEVAAFFQSSGQVENRATVLNTLGLVLLEKGLAFKKAGNESQARDAFKKSEDVLLDSVAKMRERYGFYRGVGQAYRNIALARSELGRHEDELHAYKISAQFYSKVRPVPPETDLYETYFRQADVLTKLGREQEALQPALLWLLQKMAIGDWHNQARGLKLIGEALLRDNQKLDAGYAAKCILAIYKDMLSTEEKKDRLRKRAYGLVNARENLLFANSVGTQNGDEALVKEATLVLDSLASV